MLCLVRPELPFVVVTASTIAVHMVGEPWLANLSHPLRHLVLFAWLFGVIA